MTKRVYTYHADVPEIAHWHGAQELLELWKARWTEAGFTPIVLTERDCEQSPEFAAYKAAVNRLRTTNPKAYENACWYRWFAMSLQPEGGIMSDTDVFPHYDYDPTLWLGPMATCLSLDWKDNYTVCPCLVVGSQRHFQEVVLEILKRHKAGLVYKHYSDMVFFRQYPFILRHAFVCTTHGDPKVPNPLYTHYATSSLPEIDFHNGGENSKAAIIRRILAAKPLIKHAHEEDAPRPADVPR
jgi:hypothetical protein